MNEIELALNLFKLRFSIEDTLKSLGIIRTQRILEDFGEWLVAKLMSGTLADNVNQKGWDVEANGIRYQVKTHCKAETNPAAFSTLKTLEYPTVILQLKPNFKIKNIYFSSTEALRDLSNDGSVIKGSNGYRISWHQCENITGKYLNTFPFLFNND